MTTGFFSSDSGGITPAAMVPEATDTGFFPSGGTPTLLDTPFDGVLKASTAHIGNVSIDNFPGSFSISNLPGTQRVEVASWPAVQRVALDFPAVQAVSLDFPAVQAVAGAVSVTNLPAVQDVKIVGSNGLLAGLTAGTQHVGSVSIDGPITGTVTITNPPTTIAVTNLPETQAVTGTVAVSNLPAPLTSIKINNDAGSPVPVQIVSGTAGNATTTVTGTVGLKAGTAHVGSVSLDEPVALQSGTTVGISSLPPVAITGPVTIANPVTSVEVSSIPSITGTVSVANPVTAVTINNAPGAPVPVAHQGPISLASGSAVSITGKAKIDDTTAIRVEVTNPTTGGSSFNGVLAASTAHIGNVGVDGPVTVAGTLGIVGVDGTSPTTLANHLPVGLYNTSGQALGVDVPLTVQVNSLPAVSITGTPTVTVANPFDGVIKANGVPVDDANRLPVALDMKTVLAVTGFVQTNPALGYTATDRSGTITTGGTAQVLAAADINRRGGWLQNNSTGDLWLSEVGTATIGGSSLRIPAGVLYEFPAQGAPLTALSIIGATTGQSFAARVW